MKRISPLIIAALLLSAACGGSSGGGTANVPSAPGGLTVELGDDSGQLNISWDSVDGATSYNLYWSNEPDVTKDVSVDMTKAAGTKIENVTSPYSHEGLTNGNNYYYIVTAENADGESDASSESGSVPKLNPVGTLDTDFNGMGYARWADPWSWGSGVALDSDGRIVVAGTMNDGSGNVYDLAVWRYNADGTPDTAFGGDGLITDHGAAGGNKWDFGTDVVIDSDGRIVVLGYSDGADDNYDMVIWRYNADGTLDSTFGTNGIVIYDRGVSGQNMGYGIALDSEGRIVVTGLTNGAGTGDDMTLWRFNTNGSPDSTFGTNGVVFDHSAAGGNAGDEGRSVAIDSDGKIIVVGSSNNGADDDIVVWRYDSTGTLDPTFHVDGITLYDSGNGNDIAAGVAIDSSNQPIVTGSLSSTTDIDLYVTRFTNGGALDTAFGTNGFYTYDGDNNNDGGSEVAIDPRGRLVVTGSEATAGSATYMVGVRLLSDGTADTTFGTDGVVRFNNDTIANSEDMGAALLNDEAGYIVIAGQTGVYGSAYMMLWRYE